MIFIISEQQKIYVREKHEKHTIKQHNTILLYYFNVDLMGVYLHSVSRSQNEKSPYLFYPHTFYHFRLRYPLR